VLASTLSDRGQMEGIPVALMEALASGRPVVSSRMTGIPELVVDGVNGILIPPGDADALVAALQRLATDPALRRALAAAGPPTVREAFNIHATVARLQELFALGGS
jgi:glycosyltransferase involved in cell wall biosynthesis